MLRKFRVLLVLLLLDSLPVLLLLHAELILLLLVLFIQPGIHGGLNNLPWRNRNLLRMDCRRRSRAIGLGLLSRLLPSSFLLGLVCGCLLLRRLLLRGLLSGLFRCRLLSRLLLNSFLLGLVCGCLLLRRLLSRGLLVGLFSGGPLRCLLLCGLLLGLFGGCLLLRGLL